MSQRPALSFQEELYSRLEKGYLEISEIIQFGVVIFGRAKSGKTSLAHLLSGAALQLEKDQKLRVLNSKNKNAIIGKKMTPQTIIPNKFPIQIQGVDKGSAFLFDTPGFTEGLKIPRILLNGYFDYKLFSMIKHIKFILCFDAKQLLNTGTDFLASIIEFTNTFKDYLQKKQGIWQSCAFIITKVEQSQITQENNQQIYFKRLQKIVEGIILSKLKPEEGDAFKQFVNYMIKKRRIFLVKKVIQKQQLKNELLLKQIEKKIPKWWKRKITNQNIVDMSSINFSLPSKIIQQTNKNDKSLQELVQIIKFFNDRSNQIFQDNITGNSNTQKSSSLPCIINELVNDSMSPNPQQKNSLQLMEKQVKKYYLIYDMNYEKMREKKEKQLFNIGIKKQNNNKKNLCLQKFTALREIQRLKQQMSSLKLKNDPIEWLQKSEKNIFKIITQFYKVFNYQEQSAKIIYKYGYLIKRIIENIKIFIISILKLDNGDNQQKIMRKLNNQFFKLPTILNDFMKLTFKFNKRELKYEQLHRKFIDKFELQSKVYKHIKIDQKFVTFFISIQPPYSLEQGLKMIEVILTYSNTVLAQNQKKQFLKQNDKSTIFLIKALIKARVNLQRIYEITEQKQKQNILLLLRNCTQNLGKILQSLGERTLARKTYSKIMFVHSVCKMYHQEIERLKEDGAQNSQKIFELTLQYADYMSSHMRVQQALKLLQKIYERYKGEKQKIIKQKIQKIICQIKDQNYISPYEQSIFADCYFEKFEKLEDQILTIDVEGIDFG